MKYRAEIDGLRAVAVIPVILFHAGAKYFSGGFVGVDVFFVISGYLITTIILAEKEQGSFSIVNFYERRARRILPALFLVMLVSLPFAWFWLTPANMEDFAKSLAAVSTFSSNILFWQETGYWGTANELKPLLHTWSLAVEEQYYVIFPLFLMFMWKFRKRWILGSFIFVAVTSLLLAQWGAYNKPYGNFFLLPTRGWELAIGAFVAFYFLYRQQLVRNLLAHKIIDEALGLLGLGMILYAVFAFTPSTPFPSFYALVPTLGAAFIIIFSSPQTLVGRLLSSKILVGIGLISYSAYLWHQPMLAFARNESLTKPDHLTLIILAVLSLPLAYLSWRYVEKPFRNKNVVGRKTVFVFSVVGTLIFMAIGVLGVVTNGFANRTNKDSVSLASIQKKLRINYGLNSLCTESFTLSPVCRTSDKPKILVWGDSYAEHLVRGILASNPSAKLIQMTKDNCGPFFDIAPINPGFSTKWAKSCLRFTEKVHAWLKRNKTVKYAVLSSPFEQYLRGHSKLLSRNGSITKTSEGLVYKEFEKTLNTLRVMGITPVVFTPTPGSLYGNNIGRCLALSEWRDINLDGCNFKPSRLPLARVKAFNMLKRIEKKYRVINLKDFICNQTMCKSHIGNVFVFRDQGHLSIQGSSLLGKKHDFFALITGKHMAANRHPVTDNK